MHPLLCKRLIFSCLLALVSTSLPIPAETFAGEPLPQQTARGDKMIADYFAEETDKLSKNCLNDLKDEADWTARRKVLHGQLKEMLGLDPWPEKTPLKATITGKVESEEFTVENIHFQSMPGLYVTGNFYLPKKRNGKLPTILYVCGHGGVKKNGVSLGNKTHYQHHGAWFARNGYACLTIDTIQLGELLGIHHGTYKHGMWWWNSRGYTPAGVEAWNCVRALDYLETRPEVDATRFGVTGRSGGGAYSWWISALDERIKVAVPVAGITNLQNHVVDGCVEGHCDCMYFVNTYQWDYAQLAAMVAPRPLLISNTDKDWIFPLDGVVSVYFKVRKVYELFGASKKLGLQITEGPHLDTQELRVHAFHWFNKYLKGEDPLIEKTAVKMFDPAELKVFEKLPEDEITTKIHETFTKTAGEPTIPESPAEWETMRREWLTKLKEKSFAAWPEKSAPMNLKEVFSATADGITFSAFDFHSQEKIPLRLYFAHPAKTKPADLNLIVLNVLDDQGWTEFLAGMRVGFEKSLADEELPVADKESYESTKKMFANFPWGMAYVAPRGIGRTAWNRNEKKRIQIRRRFMLLGQTLDAMRVWDVRRAIQSVRGIEGTKAVPLWLQGEREMSGITLYASLFEPEIARLDLWNLAESHRETPTFLNVLRILDVPQAVAMATERSQVRIYQTTAEGTEAEDVKKAGWKYPQGVAEKLGWEKKQFQIRKLPSPKP